MRTVAELLLQHVAERRQAARPHSPCDAPKAVRPRGVVRYPTDLATRDGSSLAPSVGNGERTDLLDQRRPSRRAAESSATRWARAKEAPDRPAAAMRRICDSGATVACEVSRPPWVPQPEEI
eukprot:scaffold1605_cov242-Pinguiococcus_pyrenoidosus.AAC.7